METKVKVQQDRTKGQGVIFNEWAFPSELEIKRYFGTVKATGRGSAAFVDLISAWSFATIEQVQIADWLQLHHRSVGTGIGTTHKAQYASSMHNCYPVPFVGTVDIVLSTQVIKCFAGLDIWRGNGLGDGTKERLINALRIGIAQHRTYCKDNLRSGTIQDHAIKTGEVTLDFFLNFMSHADDEMTMLSSLGLKE